MIAVPGSREAVVEQAKSWIGTPYHHYAKIKGVGVDCATLLGEVFRDAGVIDDPKIPPYSPQWHLHRSEEKYVEFINSLVPESFADPLPGDIVVWKFHRAFAHGGIVIEWPTVVHAFINMGCIMQDVERSMQLSVITENTQEQGNPRPKRFFSAWANGGV